ncbi:SLBB domain-containing protein [Pseudomonas sp. PCH446]
MVESSGLYIGGEETAVIASVEGGFPFPGKNHPTRAKWRAWSTDADQQHRNLAHVAHILRHGAAWYQDLGLGSACGTKLYSLSGDVLRPGLYELPMGTPLRTLIFEHGGGMLCERAFKAVFTGGPSNTLLGADDLDVPLDFDTLKAVVQVWVPGHDRYFGGHQHRAQGGGVRRLLCAGSCGQCPPCKAGTYQLSRLLRRIDTGMGLPMTCRHWRVSVICFRAAVAAA